MRQADGACGHQLQQTKEKVARLKKDGKANVARLSADKRALAVEVKAVLKDSKEVLRAAKTKFLLKVKVAKKLSVSEIQAAMAKNTAEVDKLEREKEGLRLHANRQRRQYKDTVSTLEGRHEALELLCSASQVESQKLWRDLQGQQSKGSHLQRRTMELEEEVAEKEKGRVNLCDDISRANAMYSEANKEISRMRLELEEKVEDLRKVTDRFTTWKLADDNRACATKAKMRALTTERDRLRNVR
jgi:chromosome segregation ATPase